MRMCYHCFKRPAISEEEEMLGVCVVCQAEVDRAMDEYLIARFGKTFPPRMTALERAIVRQYIEA